MYLLDTFGWEVEYNPFLGKLSIIGSGGINMTRGVHTLDDQWHHLTARVDGNSMLFVYSFYILSAINLSIPSIYLGSNPIYLSIYLSTSFIVGQIFVDGVDVTTLESIHPIVPSPYPLHIGSQYAVFPSVTGFKGSLDELRLYDIALTDIQIHQIL